MSSCTPLVPLLGQSLARGSHRSVRAHGTAAAGTGRDGRSAAEERRAESGDSWPMAFPGRGTGDVGENKKGFLCRGRRAGQAGQDGAGWELSTHSHPVPSHPILSHPTSPTGPHAGDGRTLGYQVWGSFSLLRRDSLQEQGQLRGSVGRRLGGLVEPHCADGAQWGPTMSP